uniref:Neurotransmitter-gated ion-channel transmembrane domain-containing protein n=2 Tax=Dendroctonus ponderosae TaxID=77166 RepID=A0AAR5PXR1_DENPD
MVFVFASLGEFVIVKVLQGKYSLLKQKEAERVMVTAITPWTNEISAKKRNSTIGKSGWLTLYWKTDKGKVKITWQEIDRISRIVFPVLFSLFSAVYWTILIVGSRYVHHPAEH